MVMHSYGKKGSPVILILHPMGITGGMIYRKSSPKLVEKLYPKAHVSVREGFNHCEYMFKRNEEYVAFLEKIAATDVK